MADAPLTPEMRTDFEEWYIGYCGGSVAMIGDEYNDPETRDAFCAYRAGKAATPSPPVAAVPATPVAPTDAEILQWWREGGTLMHRPPYAVIRAALAKWAQPQPQPAQPLTADQRQDLLAAAFYIACRNEPGATLKDVDAERIADLLTELSGFDLACITAPSTPTPPAGEKS